MSKKIAGGANAIVLDVTCGDGAFMKDIENARSLSKAMIDIGRIAGRPVTCVISSMRQPLGHAVGNILEMREVEDFYNGKTSEDLKTVCLTLAASMLQMSALMEDKDFSKIYALCEDKIRSGSAREAFLSFIKSQGGAVNPDGSLDYRDHPVLCAEIQSETDGYVQEVLASGIGRASVRLGAGRRVKTDRIDYGAGIMVHKKIGDYVNRGDCLCTLYTGEKAGGNAVVVNEASEIVKSAYKISSDSPEKPPEVIDILF
jgi:pyrimidine-nucleoside phosphorylase